MKRICRFVVVLVFAAAVARAEDVVDAPLPPAEAARTMVVPEGFQVTLFAGEPDVQQPIGFCIDDRARLWVAEAYSYPDRTANRGDRIVVFTDADNDGRADERKIFYEGLNYVTGIEVGFGGAWVMSPPSLYFIPDADGDLVPDGPPQVVLDGFGNHANAHNLANGFAWGPDGWLYGTHGRTNWSLVGKPGTPDGERVRFDGGVYRYHPVKKIWEPYADGTTNPWGIDWNDYGDAFVTNCVNPHLFHVIYGAHYEPWRNRESSQYAYQRIDTIADHLHFVGGNDVRRGLGSAAEDEAGGGHAHCGTMVYLGDNWPDAYRNTLFTNNIHGRRINNDLLHRHGSGYTARHGRDLMRSKEPWFMGVTLTYGPDGGVFVIDWSDTGECHSTKNTQRQTGRIYKITYGQPKPLNVDITKLSSDELVSLQSHRNDWFVRHARRVLHERAAAGQDMSSVVDRLEERFTGEADIPRKLRLVWALFTIGAADDEFLLSLLDQPSEYLQGCGVRLLCDDREVQDDALVRFREVAANGASPYVRLQIASMLQRLPHADRRPIAEALLLRGEDAGDHNIPLMVWYAVEPLVDDGVERFVALAENSRLPLVTQFIARRAASLAEPAWGLESIVRLLGRAEDPVREPLLAGTLVGLEGHRSIAMPTDWPATFAKLQKSADVEVREASLQLALVFDDSRALETMRGRVLDQTLPAATRNRALSALIAKQAAGLSPFLLSLLDDAITRRTAIRGLAEYDDPRTIDALLSQYAEFDAATRQDAIQTLAARAAWAQQLLDAVEANRIPRVDVTAYTARQLRSLHDAKLDARVEALWGKVRATPAEKEKVIAGLKKKLTKELLAEGDPELGRAIFQKTCANCHKLFDAGGAIGPNITGSQRTNIDYLLETLVDPSAAVAKDYQMQIIETTAGRVITGLVVAETAAAVTIQTVNEQVIVPRNEIDSRTPSPLSMMPEGMLTNLTNAELRGLFAYLMGPGQVPLPQ
jgi:putative membrane-bound dehydrogenase-like protein